MVVLDNHLQQQLASAALAAEGVGLPPCTAEGVLAEGILAEGILEEGVLAEHEEEVLVVVVAVPASEKRGKSHHRVVERVVPPTY